MTESIYSRSDYFLKTNHCTLNISIHSIYAGSSSDQDRNQDFDDTDPADMHHMSMLTLLL